MEIKDVKMTRVLNPTSIDLGEFVINPYKGCQFGCLYCYSRFTKVNSSDPRIWGEYVDARVNAPLLLEKELSKKIPKRVLIGSTTDCFQTSEKNYRLTWQILEILNKHKVYYNILTRSTLALDYMPLLKGGYCESIYFTINDFSDEFKNILEPKSPAFSARFQCIETLLENGINVIPYFSPILPYVSDIERVFGIIKIAKRIEFETLNFNLGNIKEIIEAIGIIRPGLKTKYIELSKDVAKYSGYWLDVKKIIEKNAKKSNLGYNIYVHNLNSFFQNTYR